MNEMPRAQIIGGAPRSNLSPEYGARTESALAGPTIFLNAVVALDPKTLNPNPVIQGGWNPGSVDLGGAPIIDDLNEVREKSGATFVITYHWGRPNAEPELRSVGIRGAFHWDRFTKTWSDFPSAIDAWLAVRGRPPFVVIDRQVPARTSRGLWVAVKRDHRLGREVVERLVAHLTGAPPATK